MANITEEHLHHMARRHHATMKQLDGLREKFAGITKRFMSTIEVGAGSWMGGAIEGKTAGGELLNIPYNLLAGGILLAAGHLELAGARWSNNLNNLGNGFVGSYLAATGYKFGKRWLETGRMFGGGGNIWGTPYENGWSKTGMPSAPPPPSVQAGALTQEDMAAIIARMAQAQGAPVYP